MTQKISQVKTKKREQETKKKKSRILYFDIFYVDLDSKGRTRRDTSSLSFFLAIDVEDSKQFLLNMSLVSCFKLPTDSTPDIHESDVFKNI